MKNKKRVVSQEAKDYASYLRKASIAKVPKTSTVQYWYFLVLKKAGIDPTTINPDDPLYGEGGSSTFPEDFE